MILDTIDINRNLILKVWFESHWYSVLCHCSSKPTGFTSSVIFDGIEEALKKDGKSLVGKVKGIFAFKVKKTDGKFIQVIFQQCCMT